jgi:hypothetical protein
VLKGTNPTFEDVVATDFAYADLLREGPTWHVLAADARTLWQTVRTVLRATGE